MARGNPRPDQVVRRLKEDGVVCLPSFFDEHTTKNMRAEAMTALKKRRRGRRTVRVRPKRRGSRRFPTLARVFYSDFLKEIARGYHPRSEFVFDRGVCVDHANRSDKTITAKHFDMKRSLKFMIYLSDVGKEDAAFSFCPGSHSENTKLRNRFLLMGGKLKDIPNVPGPNESYELVPMEGPRGTLIVFDTDGFHSAGTLQEGRERFLVRAGILLGGWFDNRTLRSAAQLNPLRFLASSLAPKERLQTRGSSRVRRH